MRLRKEYVSRNAAIMPRDYSQCKHGYARVTVMHDST